jgi:bifunctional non-homologous end joining protein LigD
MPLEQYRKKRNFSVTSEPRGRTRRSDRGNGIFVVQKHDATTLHYDFRLEIQGVLVSWAVPKGPSLNPADKRLAMMTEDHPLEYADFEGVIPEGEYGAGAIMVWDTGTYETFDEMPVEQQLARGELKVMLHGKKLEGGFVLIHSGKRSTSQSQRRRWLLIKHRDQFIDRAWDIEKTELDRSAISGRTLAEIAAGRPARKRKTRAA